MASIVSVSFLEITSFIKRVIPIPCSPDIHKTGAADVPFIKSCRVFWLQFCQRIGNLISRSCS